MADRGQHGAAKLAKSMMSSGEKGYLPEGGPCKQVGLVQALCRKLTSIGQHRRNCRGRTPVRLETPPAPLDATDEAGEAGEAPSAASRTASSESEESSDVGQAFPSSPLLPRPKVPLGRSLDPQARRYIAVRLANASSRSFYRSARLVSAGGVYSTSDEDENLASMLATL